MGQPRVYPLVNLVLEGTLEARLREQRARGLSFDSIARDLSSLLPDVSVTGETVRKWCRDLDIEAQAS